MISKTNESVCQSYPLHLLWESPFTSVNFTACFLFSHKDMETPPHTCLTGQGWSLADLEYIRIRALRDTSTLHICRLYSTSMTLLTLWDLYISTSLRECERHGHCPASICTLSSGELPLAHCTQCQQGLSLLSRLLEGLRTDEAHACSWGHVTVSDVTVPELC